MELKLLPAVILVFSWEMNMEQVCPEWTRRMVSKINKLIEVKTIRMKLDLLLPHQISTSWWQFVFRVLPQTTDLPNGLGKTLRYKYYAVIDAPLSDQERDLLSLPARKGSFRFERRTIAAFHFQNLNRASDVKIAVLDVEGFFGSRNAHDAHKNW